MWILRYNFDRWHVNEYAFTIVNNAIDSMIVQSIGIPSEVKNIITYLEQKEILELPSQIAIPNFIAKSDYQEDQYFLIGRCLHLPKPYIKKLAASVGTFKSISII